MPLFVCFLSCFRRSVIKAKRNGERRHSGEELKAEGGLGRVEYRQPVPSPLTLLLALPFVQCSVLLNVRLEKVTFY